MDIQRLKALIKNKEGVKLDFKEILNLKTESDKKEFVKDVIAIANSVGGRGYLIIGIKDTTKEIIGINPEDLNEERIQQIISYRCDPPVNLLVETVNYQDKCVGVITIFKSPLKPHQMRQTGAFYIRRGSTTDFARRYEIANMFQEIGLISNELIPLYNLGINVLNRHLINEYIKKMGLPSNESVEKDIWLALGIAYYDDDTNKFYPTLGGLLLFCEHPQIYMPYFGIKIITYDQKMKKITNIGGSIIDMLNRSQEFLQTYLKPYDYPIEPVFQCIVNAVVHRDYFDLTKEIVVVIGSTKIEVSNPGTLPKGTNTQTIIRELNPAKRNNWLYQRLMTIDKENRFLGTNYSLQNLIGMFQKNTVRLLNIERRNLFKVILPGFKVDKIFKNIKEELKR